MDPIFAVAIFVLMMSCLGFAAYKKAPQIKAFFTAHPFALKLLLWGYIIFNACFSFPISSQRFPLDFSKAYLLIASYGVIAISFAGIYGVSKHFSVLAQTFIFCKNPVFVIGLKTASTQADRFRLQYCFHSDLLGLHAAGLIEFLRARVKAPHIESHIVAAGLSCKALHIFIKP